MQSAKQIFDEYFNKNLVINSQQEFEELVIIPAMEAYRLQYEEAAFNAARQTHGADFTFGTYAHYLDSLKTPDQPVEDPLRNMLQQAAESIIELYIPADGTQTEFSFSFNAESKRYQVTYRKDAEGFWYFDNYQET